MPEASYALTREALAEKLREELGRKAAESKGVIFNTAITANANIFASALTPTYTPCIFRIYCCFSASGVLSVRRTKAGVTVSEQLNSGTALIANAAYAFDIIVGVDETINLQYSVNATCLCLEVIEVSASI
jgi:hypothetical protein